jgi:hypothetical protein
LKFLGVAGAAIISLTIVRPTRNGTRIVAILSPGLVFQSLDAIDF